MLLVAHRLLEAIDQWMAEGRFPREELRFRWWTPLAAVGLFVLVIFAIVVCLSIVSLFD